MDYKDWLKYKSNLEGRDLSKDEQDYDMEGYYNSLKYNDKDYKAGQGMHLPDTFKKPNHPTFSDESKYSIPGIRQGGKWDETGFTPSKYNLNNMPNGRLQQYFNKVEPEMELKIPNNQKISMANDRQKQLDELALANKEAPIGMAKPDKRGLMGMILGRYADQPIEPEVKPVPVPVYPEPYAVDKSLKQQGFQIPEEKRLMFEKIARMLGK